MRRSTIATLCLAVLAVLILPMRVFFFFRDAGSTHLPLLRLLSSYLRAGQLPVWNDWMGGGQPLAANPNVMLFYPTSLLHFVLPPAQVLTAHFLLHLLIAGVAMHALVYRRTGDGRVALLAGISYALCGTAVSMLSLMNLMVVFAMAPLILLALESFLETQTARDAFLLGVAGGLAGLSGEPASLAGLGVVLLFLSIGRLQRRHLAGLVLSALTAAAVVLPLFIASTEVLHETERARFGFSARTVLNASLHPLRLAETFLGPYPGSLLRGTYAHLPGASSDPMIQCIFLGSLFVVGFLAAPKRARRYVGAGALLVVGALGRYNPLVAALVGAFPSLRFARYPEKLMIAASACIIVAGSEWLVEARSPQWRRRTGIALTFMALLASITMTSLPPASVLLLVAGGIVAVFTIFAAWRGWMRLAMLVHLLSLALVFLLLVPADDPHYYEEPAGRSDVRSVWLDLGDWSSMPARERTRIAEARHEPYHAIGEGGGYALMVSVDGMSSWRSRIAAERMQLSTFASKLHWAQIAGCTSIHASAPSAGTAREAWMPLPGQPPFFRYRVENSRGLIHAPESVRLTGDLPAAVDIIESASFDPATESVIPFAVAGFVQASTQPAAGTEGSGQIAFRADNAGPSVVVLNESYFEAWDVRRNGERLKTFPADLDRLGVLLPPGQGVVIASFSRRRGLILAAWVVSLMIVMAGMGAVVWGRVRVKSEMQNAERTMQNAE